MPMIQTTAQYPPAIRIPALKAAVLQCRAVKEGAAKDEAAWMDQLAQAEAEATDTGVPLSGLIPEGQNPHLQTTPPVAPAGHQGDMVDPNTGESSGGAAPGGSASSPHPEHGSHHPHSQHPHQR